MVRRKHWTKFVVINCMKPHNWLFSSLQKHVSGFERFPKAACHILSYLVLPRRTLITLSSRSPFLLSPPTLNALAHTHHVIREPLTDSKGLTVAPDCVTVSHTSLAKRRTFVFKGKKPYSLDHRNLEPARNRIHWVQLESLVVKLRVAHCHVMWPFFILFFAMWKSLNIVLDH